MSTYKDISESDITISPSSLNQVIDVVGDYISGSGNTVQTYTQLGSSGTFQTVYDQDITSITSNKIMDITFGQASTSRLTASLGLGTKDLEVKQQIYRQFAQTLLGSADSRFTVPFLSSSTASEITEAVFIGIKRLFHRDKVLENTMYMNLIELSGSDVASDYGVGERYYVATDANFGRPNITPIQTEVTTLFSGTADTNTPIGLVFLEQGVVVLDVSRSFDGDQSVLSPKDGKWFSGQRTGDADLNCVLSGSTIDEIVTSFRTTRFLTGSNSGSFNVGMEWQNVTLINSALIKLNIGFEDFNLSSNPTFVDANGTIRTLNGSNINNPVTFITSFGLHDAAGNLLAVGKPSRPIPNSREASYSPVLRLDF